MTKKELKASAKFLSRVIVSSSIFRVDTLVVFDPLPRMRLTLFHIVALGCCYCCLWYVGNALI
jgi:hypothetical protein